MRITLVSKNKNNVTEKITYDLYDEYNPETQTSSMARTTGYTATAAANLVLENLFTEKGIFPPELIGHDEKCFSFIINYLKERNVIYNKTTQLI
jgi:saccharopine dehydrogenase-like NADP-dependent oxidoreductase